MLVTKIFRGETKVLDEEAGIVSAVASTEVEDRDGDIIRASGWSLDNFLKHPVLLSSHNYASVRSQIGEWTKLEVKGNKLVGEARYYIGEGNEEADWAFKLAQKGRAAYSVGFLPDMEKAEARKGGKGYEFKAQELLEVSHVTVPSNPASLQAVRGFVDPVIKDIIDEQLSETKPEGLSPCCLAAVNAEQRRILDALLPKAAGAEPQPWTPSGPESAPDIFALMGGKRNGTA